MLEKREGYGCGKAATHNLKTWLQSSLEILGLQDQQGVLLQLWGKVPAEDTTRCHHLIKGRSQDFQRKGWRETAQTELPPPRVEHTRL